MRDFQRPNLSKILKAIAFLFDQATTRSVTALEIMQAIGEIDSDATSLSPAELKKFQRLKRDIRDLGIPLETPLSTGRMQDEGASEYRIPRREYALKGLGLSPSEEALLALLGGFIAHDEGFPLRTNLAIALEKISQVTSGSLTQSRIPGSVFPSPEESEPKRDPEVLNKLILANSKNQPVAFSYQGVHSDAPKKRKVEPYGLFTRRQIWYLVGRDVEKDEVRVFRIGRIADPQNIEVHQGESFSIPESFQLREYASVPPWNFFSSAEETEVELEFSHEEFWRVDAFCRQHGKVAEREDQATVLWSPRVKEFDPLIMWLLPYGTAVRPIAPPEFKERYREIVRESLSRYAGAND